MLPTRVILVLEDAVEELKWTVLWNSNKGGERLKDQLTEIAESLESRNKDDVKIICVAKNEAI